MAFRFNLETLLRLRRNQQEQEERVLRAIHSNLAAARHTLEQLLLERQSAGHQLNQRLQEGAGGLLLREHQAGEELRSRREQALRELIEKLERARQMQAERFQQSWRRCRTLENLRERQFHEWQTEQQRQEQKRLDDLVLTRFRRC